VNGFQRTIFRTANRVTPWLYRVSKGRMGNRSRGGSPVLMLTVKGRKSGNPFTVPVAYFPRDGGWVVVGSAGGDKDDPQWFRNLRAADSAVVELGNGRREVAVRVLEGPERDDAFRDVVAANPGFGKYEAKAGRPMPLALLTPR
jgi:deazaflavin-dependent oxidoreductase (nitroreductase family)